MGVPEVWIFSSPFIVIAYVKGECDDEDDSDNAAALPHPELQGLSVDDSLGSPTDPLGCHSSYCTDRLHLNTVSSLTKNIKKCQKHYFFSKLSKSIYTLPPSLIPLPTVEPDLGRCYFRVAPDPQMALTDTQNSQVKASNYCHIINVFANFANLGHLIWVP